LQAKYLGYEKSLYDVGNEFAFINFRGLHTKFALQILRVRGQALRHFMPRKFETLLRLHPRAIHPSFGGKSTGFWRNGYKPTSRNKVGEIILQAEFKINQN